MKQRVLSGVLASTLMLSCMFYPSVSATSSVLEDVYETTSLSEATIASEEHFICSNGTIIKYIGPGGTVAIPSVIGGQTVTSISAEAFSGNNYVTIVAIPESVTSIGANAFANCSKLIAVNFSSNLRSIGDGAFYNSGLQSIDLPSSVQVIGAQAFAQCSSLVHAILPSSLSSVGDSVFAMTASLSEVTVYPSTFSANTSATTFATLFWDTTGRKITFYAMESMPELAAFCSNNGYTYWYDGQSSGGTEDDTGDTWYPDYPEWSGYAADVSWDSWYAHHVYYMLDRGFMTVDYQRNFYPTVSCDRQTVADIIVRVLNVSTTGVSHGFTDISNSPYQDAIAWCAREGLLSGYDNANFGPSDYLTRQQFVATLRSLARYMGINTAVLEDYVIWYHDGHKVDSWARTSMMWAVEQGFIRGENLYLKPQGYVTRTEVAIILRSFLLKYDL